MNCVGIDVSKGKSMIAVMLAVSENGWFHLLKYVIPPMN